MYARPKYELISRSELNLTAASFAAQQTKIAIPSTDPIEEILIVFQGTLGNTVPAGSWIVHGIMGILKKIGLYVSPPDGSFDALNVSGPGILMLADQEGLRLDRSTQATRGAVNINYSLTGSIYRVAYRISFPHPALVGQLRMRSLLDVQNHKADPILTLDWGAAAEWVYNVADPLSAASCEVFVARRDIGRPANDAILQSGGFFRQDIRETSYPVAASTTQESRFAIPSPGEYATLVIAHQKGATNINRLGDLSANVTLGQETLWSLESGGNSLMKFRMKDLQLFGDYTRVALPPQLNATGNEGIVTTVAGVLAAQTPVAKIIVNANEFGGPLASGMVIQDPAVVGMDFLSNAAADADDLSSLLNANFASDAIKWELVGNTTGPAAGTSNVQIIGRRFRSNVTPWKVQKAA